MKFVLSKNIEAGQKIRTANGWRKIKQVTEEGVIVKEGLVEFGEVIYGWKKR